MVPIVGLERAGIALAESRLIPPLDHLMLADYDASTHGRNAQVEGNAYAVL
jgi:hypothetical protein